MGFLTGNEIVDAVSKINFQGDITPRIWRKTITKANGKPYALARDILSDFVYWYRATEVVDPDTMEITMKKKFRDDLLYQSYEQLCNEFGESKRVIRDALKRLEELGVLKRHFRTVTYENGYTANNVMYIELIPEVLQRLTYPDLEDKAEEKETAYQAAAEEAKETANLVPVDKEEMAKKRGLLPPDDKNVNRGKESERENNNPPVDENVSRVVTNLSRYTEITTENTDLYNNHNQSIREGDKKNSIEQKDVKNPKGQGKNSPVDGMDSAQNRADEFVTNTVLLRAETKDSAVFWNQKQVMKKKFLSFLPSENGETYSMDFVREWFDYTDLLTLHGRDSTLIEWQKEIDGVMNILYDVLNTTKPSIRVGGEEKPSAVVIGRLLNLSIFDIQYALNQYHAQTTRIRNQRSYLLTILYMAKEQQNLDVSNQVAYDMAWKED